MWLVRQSCLWSTLPYLALSIITLLDRVCSNCRLPALGPRRRPSRLPCVSLAGPARTNTTQVYFFPLLFNYASRLFLLAYLLPKNTAGRRRSVRALAVDKKGYEYADCVLRGWDAVERCCPGGHSLGDDIARTRSKLKCPTSTSCLFPRPMKRGLAYAPRWALTRGRDGLASRRGRTGGHTTDTALFVGWTTGWSG